MKGDGGQTPEKIVIFDLGATQTRLRDEIDHANSLVKFSIWSNLLRHLRFHYAAKTRSPFSYKIFPENLDQRGYDSRRTPPSVE
ncbi:hypothetical protein GCM10025857_31650 [Alicyclobacillus contaminans]|nr:hypothetical protein GCM10025857_31650 [Alicyclobacillus contaminans]